MGSAIEQVRTQLEHGKSSSEQAVQRLRGKYAGYGVARMAGFPVNSGMTRAGILQRQIDRVAVYEYLLSKLEAYDA